ncbi:MAG TPA: hypothetical protein VFE62_14880 [Gemmataceae bacterium]|nr:hypothetical protein [Gemmataceae bacterium]
MELGRRLIETHKMPICLINGAVGGTRIDQHQRNADNPEDPTRLQKTYVPRDAVEVVRGQCRAPAEFTFWILQRPPDQINGMEMPSR